MAEKEMDVIGSLHKISRELGIVGKDVRMPEDLATIVDGAAFMIDWIAKGLDREFQLAHERSMKLHRELNP